MVNKYNILIIDDDPGIIDILSLILLNHGYNVTSDTTGELEFLETRIYPDLILLDNQLGEKSGVSICFSLKQNEKTRTIPIILESGNEDLYSLAANACADDYLSKPFCIKTLLKKVETLLARKEVVC
jgi:DNA-binding response OmpR family regulator